MKKLFIFVSCLMFAQALSAQDIITKADGTDIQAKVTEVSQKQISYKKFSNLNGPTYTIDASDILMITYENGEREMFNVKNRDKEKISLPQGVMTYNSWSGKVSVDGVTIEKEMLNRYFSQEDYKSFLNGKTLTTVGGIFAIAGAFPFGWSVGTAIGGGKPNLGLLIGGGVAFVGGLIVSFAGEAKVKSIVNKYNSSLAFQPQFHFGATNNGIGLALAF